jgi:undecaprenyl-diphosphatase
VWLFALLTGQVINGDAHSFDVHLMLLLHESRSTAALRTQGWPAEMLRDITALGSVFSLTLVTLAVIGFFVIARRWWMAALVGLGIGGGWLLNTVLKDAIDRPRPDIIAHATQVFTASFPSSHAMMSAIVYLTLGALMSQALPQRSLKAYVLMVAILLVFLVGTSRVLLGVHWPSDILAGWAIGAAWALSWWLVAGAVTGRQQRAGALRSSSLNREP